MRLENTYIAVEGVGETTERTLWREGATRWDEFDPSLVGPTTGERIRSFIDEARDRLADDDAAYFDRQLPDRERWRCYENFRDSTLFFDIETTGLDQERDRVTCVSFHRDGETETLVRGDDLTRENLRAKFSAADLIATYNGRRFDVPFLESSFDLSIDTPHVDAMYPCRRLDLTGGLKTVEREIGIDRDRPDLSGEDAVRLWREYERGDADALETLISYNRDDARNLRRLLDAVTDRLDERTIGAAVDGR